MIEIDLHFTRSNPSTEESLRSHRPIDLYTIVRYPLAFQLGDLGLGIELEKRVQEIDALLSLWACSLSARDEYNIG